MENSQLRPLRTADFQARVQARIEQEQALQARIQRRLEQATAEAMSDPDSQELLANLNRNALKSEAERKRREAMQGHSPTA